MRAVVAVVVALVRQVDTGSVPRRPASDTLPCVRTEHMPIAGLHTRPHDPMPVLRVDSTFHSKMPVLRLRACYLVDSLGVQRR